MKTLLLISGDAQADPRGPRPAWQALAEALSEEGDGSVDVLDHRAARRASASVVRFARRWGGLDWALAMIAFRRRREYDVIFSDDDRIGGPLALLLAGVRSRPGHVCVGRRFAQGRAGLAWSLLGACHGLDTALVYAQSQRDFAEDRLGFAGEQLSLIPPPVDEHFFRPQPEAVVCEDHVGIAGRPCPSDPALLGAVASFPSLTLERIEECPESASCPDPCVSTDREEDEIRRRALYARSGIITVPLPDVDAPAGIAAVLEAMAMGKAVVTTRTEGLSDIILDGVTGLTVTAGDEVGWRRALGRLQDDLGLRERLGRAARRWVEENAGLERWAAHARRALRDASAARADGAVSGPFAASASVFW